MKHKQDNIFLLTGKIQHYAWGGFDFIPQLLGNADEKDQPSAEYWMGAHPSASSIIEIMGHQLPLNALVKVMPRQFLGKKTYMRFGELPYLFKVLDVKKMLSIQVHPSKAEAEKGFDAEEAAGIPISDKNRNYKDRNHKPEMMVALSEFWLLHGFLAEEKLLSVLENTPEFASLIPVFKKKGYKGLYRQVMEMSQEAVDKLLTPLVKREIRLEPTDKSLPGFWVNRLYEGISSTKSKNIDRGIFSIYFFNIVRAMPGEAVFQGAGIPHAYLEGQNMELMANSDNVLRGGLTPKHIDVPELLKHTNFEGVTPQILKGKRRKNGELVYPKFVPDFGMGRIILSKDERIECTSFSMEIIFVTSGNILLEGYNKLKLKKGEAAIITARTNYSVSAKSATAEAFKAFVPKF